MSTKNHTPISVGSPANSSTFNSPLGQLDSSLGDLSTLTTTAKNDIVSAVNELDSTKQDNFTTQSQNQVLASPNGSSGTPGFRSLVNGDLPNSGTSAGTFTKVTVNSKGVITGGTNLSISDISDVTSIAVDTLGAPTDNTNNNTSTLKHGFFPKLVNDSMQLFNGVGAWVKWAMGIKYNGSGTYTPRSFVNFSGAGVSVQDDPANDAIKVTISGIAGGTQTLETLTDVSLASPVANEVLTYNASSSTWENKNITSFVPTGHVVSSAGSNLTNRPTLNFAGTGVTTVDNSTNNRTDVTINAPSNASTSTAGLATLATSTQVTTGTSDAVVVTPNALADSDYGKRGVQLALNGSVALTTSDKGYFRIPSHMNGWVLVAVSGMCKVASTSGTPTFTVKKGSTSMLSTDLTIDQSETDSSTATTPVVINSSTRTVATGDQIEVACSVAGTGVTYSVVDLVFQLP